MAQRKFIAEVDPLELLKQLPDIDTPIWCYTDETIEAALAEGIAIDDSPHCGPMADDLLKHFGLGDGQVVVATDVIGSVMILCKGLLQLVERNALELDVQRLRIATLEKGEAAAVSTRLEELETKVNDLLSDEMEEDYAALVGG